MKPGTKVVCSYRHPSPRQPWIHPIYVGVIEEPEGDPKKWNGRNSEAAYCEATGKARVRYTWGVMQDSLDSLSEIPDGFEELNHKEQVRAVLGDEAADRLTDWVIGKVA